MAKIKAQKSANGAVAAAIETVPDATAKIVKAHDTIVAHASDLEDRVAELEAELAQTKERDARELATVTEKLTARCKEAEARANVAEQKNARAFGELAR